MARRKKDPNERYEVLAYGKAVPYVSPTGIKTHLYNISTAAMHLGRTAQTIRKWEISGTIPLTPFKVKGNRMYSAEHIDVLIAAATRSHIRAGVSICNTSFSSDVYKGYKEVYDKFFGKESKNGGKD